MTTLLPKLKSPASLVLGPAENTILRGLLQYGYLTNDQICRLLGYRPSSITFVRDKLHRLTQAGYCTSDIIPRKTRTGASPLYFFLGRKGVAYLRQNGYPELRYFPSKHGGLSEYLLTHTLAVNDMLLAASLLTRNYPTIIIAQLHTEPTLKRSPLYVQDAEGKRQAVIPDAWVDFEQTCVAFEVDRGHEEQRKWRRKVAGYLAAMQGSYRNAFGTDLLAVAVIACPGKVSPQQRARALRHWTELELGQNNPLAELFLFTAVPSLPPDPERLFLSPCWEQPFSDTPVSLLEA